MISQISPLAARRGGKQKSRQQQKKKLAVVVTILSTLSVLLLWISNSGSLFLDDVQPFLSSVGRTIIKKYTPSKIESHFLEKGRLLGLDNKQKAVSGCESWKDTKSPIAKELSAFRLEIKAYQEKLSSFKGKVTDLRDHINHDDHTICDSLELHPQGLKGIFASGSLSQTSDGFLEPLFPPMRTPEVCFQEGNVVKLSLDYLIHDFSAYCRRLKPKSRIVLLDMGASLDFHHAQGQVPAVYLTQIYQQFGFHWDHIYAYEMQDKKPADVFDQVPEDLFHAYHWINVGVNSAKGSKMNPWNMLLREYKEDDFVVVKLDIDSPEIEIALAKQLSDSPELLRLVDVFYFEHHVLLKELAYNWGISDMHKGGSILSSLKFFQSLREAGVDAHFWV